MSGDHDTDEWWTTNHELIRNWADARDAYPVVDEGAGDDALRIEAPSDADGRDGASGSAPDSGSDDGERTWAAFFERFDAEDKAFLYRSPEAVEGSGTDRRWAIVDREGLDDRVDAARNVDDPGAHETFGAVSDTGEGEPVASGRSEAGSDTDPGTETPGTTTTRDAADPASDRYEGLVVDEIREAGGSLDPGGDEYVTFANAGDRSIDLSGLTVRNEAGRSYRFDDAVLDPDDRLTLHSGSGTDTETDRYWDADDPVWVTGGETVIVESPSGERIVEEQYKGGRD